jgi:hypothetical protein
VPTLVTGVGLEEELILITIQDTAIMGTPAACRLRPQEDFRCQLLSQRIKGKEKWWFVVRIKRVKHQRWNVGINDPIFLIDVMKDSIVNGVELFVSVSS